MNKLKRDRFFKLGLFIAYTLLSVLLLLVHEPWRDEAQQWLYVKNQSFLSMLSNLHFEGHPAVWYILLWPFAKLGFSYFTSAVIHLYLVLFCGWLLIYKSPFKPHLKILMLFSMVLGYYFNAISRSYILIGVLLFLIAAVFPQRHGRYKYLYGLLLLLLINTYLYAALAAAVIVFYDLLTLHPTQKLTMAYIKSEKVRGFLISFVFFAAGLIILFLTLHGERDYYAYVAADPTNYLQTDYLPLGLNILKSGFGGNIIGYFLFLFKNLQNVPIHYGFLMFFNNVILMIPVLFLLFYKFKPAIMLICFTALLSVFAAAGTPLNYWNTAVIFVFYIFCMWISEVTKDELAEIDIRWDGLVNIFTYKKVNIFYLGVLLVLVINTFAMCLGAYSDIKYPFSNALSAANYIEANGYDTANTCIITHDVPQTDAILPYLNNIKYLSLPGWSDKISYCTWDRSFMVYNPDEETIFSYAREKFNSEGKVPLVIYDTKAKNVPVDFVCIYTGTKNVITPDEQFSIYTLKQTEKGS